MDIRIYPSKLSGTITPPSSKSAAHRALICAILSKGKSRIANIGKNDDILASIACAKALGANISFETENTLIVEGINTPINNAFLDCNESGSTLRFFAPIPAALGIDAVFAGKGRLPQRPMNPLLDLMTEHGVTVINTQIDEIFSSTGQLTADIYEIPGNISSQYISGLLFALPLLKSDSQIMLTTDLESKGYIDMTIQMLARFGVVINSIDNGYLVAGGQTYTPTDLTVENDYSSAAFWLCAAAMGHDITVSGLDPESLQSDRDILDVLTEFGAKLTISDGNIKVTRQNLSPINIDANNIPDSVPILSVLATTVLGETRIYNAQRLRIKESDRLLSTSDGLTRMGAGVSIVNDELLISGGNQLHGANIDSYADHRIAMAMSIAALSADSPSLIEGAQCADKSYPDFYKDLEMLGGKTSVI